MKPTLEDFKIFLILHDIPINPYFTLVSLCPEILAKYSFEDIIMTAPYLAKELKPKDKTIIVAPIIYNSVILDAMQNKSAIMAHISSILAAKSETIIQRELLHLFKLAHARLVL